MAQVKHAFVSAKADDPDSALVNPSDWNANHAGIEVIRKTALETVINSITLQDDDHLLLALAANEVWEFEGTLLLTGAETGDFKMAFTIPSGATISWSALGLLGPATAENQLVTSNVIEASGAAITFGVLNGKKIPVIFRGVVVNGATAGNLQLQWAQSVSDGSGTVIHINSYLKAYRES